MLQGRPFKSCFLLNYCSKTATNIQCHFSIKSAKNCRQVQGCARASPCTCRRPPMFFTVLCVPLRRKDPPTKHGFLAKRGSTFEADAFSTRATLSVKFQSAVRHFPVLQIQMSPAVITGSALALHCCKAHSKINRKMGNSTPCKIVIPNNFKLKLCIREYVGEACKFGSNR